MNPLYIEIAKYALIGVGAVMFAVNLLPKKIRIEEQLNKAFLASKLFVKHEKDLLLTPMLQRRKKTKSGYLLTYTLPPGLGLSDFINAKEKLEFAVGSEIDMWAENNLVRLNIMTDKLPNKIEFNEDILKPLEKMKLGFPTGYSKGGFIYGDFLKSAHWRVAGFTRSGKSVFIRLVLTSLYLVYNKVIEKPKVLFRVVDLKEGVEFQWLNGIKHAEVAETEDQAEDMLEELNKELTKRAKMLKKIGAVNLVESNLKLPFIVVVIDEYAELKDNEDAHKMINRLLRMGAFAGIHLIVCSQRLDKDVFPGAEKANAPGVVCFRVTDEIDSMVMLKNNSAARLPEIKGRAIYKFNRQREIQVPFMSKEQAEELLSQFKKDTNDLVEEEILKQIEQVQLNNDGVL